MRQCLKLKLISEKKYTDGKKSFKEEQIHKSLFLKLKKIVMKKFPKLKLEFHIMKLH